MTEIVPFQRVASAQPDVDRARVSELRVMSGSAGGGEQLAILGELSELLRALGEFDESAEVAEEASELAMSLGDDRRQASNAVRLATALQYAGRYADANRVFSKALARSEPGFVEYRHFLLQHWGKCLVEMDRCDEARSAFEEALQLRRTLGDEGYLASTARAITGLDERSASSALS